MINNSLLHFSHICRKIQQEIMGRLGKGPNFYLKHLVWSKQIQPIKGKVRGLFYINKLYMGVMHGIIQERNGLGSRLVRRDL